MNKTEYYNSGIRHHNYEYKRVQKLLKEWKAENNIVEACVVHHRDDNEECRKYNEEHYELWGFNEDGTFEDGKYVWFITAAEHNVYHNKGENNPFYGKHHSDEAKAKISASRKGKIFSEEHRAKLSASHTGKKNPNYGKQYSDETKEKMRAARKEYMQIMSDAYKKYKLDGGILMWQAFLKQYNKSEQIINDASKV